VKTAGWIVMAAFLAGTAAPALANLDQARAEPNLEKRSKLALDNADSMLHAARMAYRAGDTKTTAADAKELQESVDLAYQSLTDTGKNPRKSPRWFKHAEIKTRELLRLLDNFQQEMSYTDRPILDGVKANIQQVHDDLLTGLMEGRKKP
jgi:hypothetical protein